MTKRETLTPDGVPTRSDPRYWGDAERFIAAAKAAAQEAVLAVGRLGSNGEARTTEEAATLTKASAALTTASVLLSDAQRSVGDVVHVEEVPAGPPESSGAADHDH